LHAIDQSLRRLRTIKIVPVLHAPRFELYAFPAAWQALLNDRDRLSQLTAAQHVDVEIPPVMRVRSEYPSAEQTLNTLQRLEIAPVYSNLERGLLAIAGERPSADDQTHSVTERKGVHGPKI